MNVLDPLGRMKSRSLSSWGGLFAYGVPQLQGHCSATGEPRLECRGRRCHHNWGHVTDACWSPGQCRGKTLGHRKSLCLFIDCFLHDKLAATTVPSWPRGLLFDILWISAELLHQSAWDPFGLAGWVAGWSVGCSCPRAGACAEHCPLWGLGR